MAVLSDTTVCTSQNVETETAPAGKSKSTVEATVTAASQEELPPIAHLDKHGYLFGKKLTASMSPTLHSAIYKELGLNWEQLRLDSTDMDLFLRLIQHKDFYGASVTMPHKVAIIDHLDELEPECRAVGACNTIFLRQHPTTGRRLFCGQNTDIIGIRDSFKYNVPNPESLKSRPGLIIGGGGAARSAVYALQQCLGIREVYIVNRDKSEVDAVLAECASRGFGAGLSHVETVAEAESRPSPGAIVSCVPDYPPKTESEHVARRIIETFLGKNDKGSMLEMCYNPSPYTELGALAEQNGWQVILGTEALIYQGLEQDRYWTGRELSELPVAQAKECVATRLARLSKDARS